ncbi:hypothetical protein E3N88_12023 [Mikania micrantha]|uniref:Uncharacterized protein n=1 Tax=Mikania micrantha TaxID=192012 RepID=A0A5N6P4B8_9ASTR|nr:hypothetical protein E3N88_12023 [Mikania micrantha]
MSSLGWWPRIYYVSAVGGWLVLHVLFGAAWVVLGAVIWFLGLWPDNEHTVGVRHSLVTSLGCWLKGLINSLMYQVGTDLRSRPCFGQNMALLPEGYMHGAALGRSGLCGLWLGLCALLEQQIKRHLLADVNAQQG